MQLEGGQNYSRYGAVVFYIPEKGRRKKRGKYVEIENIFLWRRRKRGKLFFAEENNNGVGTV